MPSCFLRCWITGLSDQDVEGMLKEIEDSVPYEDRAQFKSWVQSLPGSIGSKYLAVVNQAHKILARTPQKGAGAVGIAGKAMMPRAVKKQVLQGSIKIVGANGAKYFGRVGSKVIPYIGQIAFAVEVANVCKCKIACEDGKYEDDEKFFQ